MDYYIILTQEKMSSFTAHIPTLFSFQAHVLSVRISWKKMKVTTKHISSGGNQGQVQDEQIPVPSILLTALIQPFFKL